MLPGSQWKSSVNEVKNKTDRLSKQIDKLAEVDNRFKKTMFANPNTKVTLEVKTRKPDTNNWSSMLSDNTAGKMINYMVFRLNVSDTCVFIRNSALFFASNTMR